MPRTCKEGQKLRDGVCCNPTTCYDTGFKACTENNGNDVCIPCPEGFFLNGNYSTDSFSFSPCAKIQMCLPEETRDENGNCVCDRSRQYISEGQGPGNCRQVRETCRIRGYELNDYGNCTECSYGYFKNTSTNEICMKKSYPKCAFNAMINEGNSTTDRTCVPKDITTQNTTPKVKGTTTLLPSIDSGAAIGMVVGIGVLIALCFMMFHWICKRCRQRKRKKKTSKKNRGIEHEEEHLDGISVKHSNIESDKTKVEAPVHYTSGLFEKDTMPKAVPFSSAELPQPQQESNIDGNGTSTDISTRYPRSQGQIGEEDVALLSIAAQVEGGDTIPKCILSQDEETYLKNTVDGTQSPRPSNVLDVPPDANRHRYLTKSSPPVATVHPQVTHASLEQITNPPLLTENPVEDDRGRLVNGPNSQSMPNRCQNGDATFTHDGFPQGQVSGNAVCQENLQHAYIEQQGSPPLLGSIDQIVRDDPGRYVNGPHSGSMPFREQNGTQLQNGNPPGQGSQHAAYVGQSNVISHTSGVQPVNEPSLGSDSYNAINPSNSM